MNLSTYLAKKKENIVEGSKSNQKKKQKKTLRVAIKK